jgi:dTDP-4-amino-4,6-dideoxygalactose transaminase
MLRDHGQAKKYYHDFVGYNGRLDAIQCGILRIKLKHLAKWNEKRRQNASLYNQLLSNNSTLDTRHSPPDTQHLTFNTVVTPFVPSWAKPVFHLYIIRAQKRDELQKYLTENGIGTGLHYPIPLHLQKAYAGLECTEGDFPITEGVANEILSLPMFPRLTSKQIEYITSKIRKFYS